MIPFDVRDPIERTEKAYVLRQNFHQLDQHRKIRGTICNLFANHQQSIDQLDRLYEMSSGDVVTLLLAENLVIDKRRNPFEAIKGGRRETDH